MQQLAEDFKEIRMVCANPSNNITKYLIKLPNLEFYLKAAWYICAGLHNLFRSFIS